MARFESLVDYSDIMKETNLIKKLIVALSSYNSTILSSLCVSIASYLASLQNLLRIRTARRK